MVHMDYDLSSAGLCDLTFCPLFPCALCSTNIGFLAPPRGLYVFPQPRMFFPQIFAWFTLCLDLWRHDAMMVTTCGVTWYRLDLMDKKAAARWAP